MLHVDCSLTAVACTSPTSDRWYTFHTQKVRP